jgi:hypothetical protein
MSEGTTPSWYLAYQLIVIGTGVLMIMFGLVMTHRRIKSQESGKWLHAVIHGVLVFNGCVYIVWGVDPWCVAKIYPYSVPFFFRNVLNLTLLSSVLLWTSALLEGIKEVEGVMCTTAKLRLWLWKIPTALLAVLLVVCQILANLLNAEWPMGIITLTALLICSGATAVSIKALIKVTEVFQKSRDHLDQVDGPQTTNTRARTTAILKLRGTIIVLLIQVGVGIYNCAEYLPSKDTLEQSIIPQNTTKPFFPTAYITRTFILPLMMYLFYIPPSPTSLPAATQVSTGSPKQVQGV